MPKELEDFKLLAGKTIKDLSTEKFPGLLVFPRDLGQSEDLSDEACIYSLSVKSGDVVIERKNGRIHFS